ncbi:hypothetical protein AVI51_00260 [Piscirickettsia salmonis]|nr:hypothetical protein [Piscirickettsia salmonis]APS44835.1 hypothetical protein AVI48_10990 [Piscirickettsia salmonis]APS48196.1 hypothetical protein AVI49_11595 [Piscirickettsia salmonis]APS49466.1 hypothetical protein AVI50_00285 [Piscirickettsia salmonis]APS52642.1 hypothetical protein AVI51_00260 [Piscirickettsia salmonis]QIX56017.1 hypothetical protein GW536_11850 [Piscirickettsia salmonis]
MKMLFEDLRASVLALIDNIKKNMGYRQLDGLALYRSHVIHAKSFKKLLITLDNLQEYETIEDYLSVSQYEHVKQELKRYQQTTQEEIENEEKFSSLRSIISKFLISVEAHSSQLLDAPRSNFIYDLRRQTDKANSTAELSAILTDLHSDETLFKDYFFDPAHTPFRTALKDCLVACSQARILEEKMDKRELNNIEDLRDQALRLLSDVNNISRYESENESKNKAFSTLLGIITPQVHQVQSAEELFATLAKLESNETSKDYFSDPNHSDLNTELYNCLQASVDLKNLNFNYVRNRVLKLLDNVNKHENNQTTPSNGEQTTLLKNVYAQITKSQSERGLICALNNLQEAQTFQNYFSNPKNYYFKAELKYWRARCNQIEILEEQQALKDTDKKKQLLSDIETIIVNQVRGYGFDLGIGGSEHSIRLSERESFQV